MSTTQVITVRDSNGAYQTNTVRKQRASSTCSAEQAARQLCGKLFPDQQVKLELQSRLGSTTVFVAEVEGEA